jgi:hypothetical protein
MRNVLLQGNKRNIPQAGKTMNNSTGHHGWCWQDGRKRVIKVNIQRRVGSLDYNLFTTAEVTGRRRARLLYVKMWVICLDTETILIGIRRCGKMMRRRLVYPMWKELL